MAASAKVGRTLSSTFIVVLTISALVFAWRDGPASLGATPSLVAAGVPECPMHDDTTNVSIAEPIKDIPEFHDCQRLVRTSGPERYGPLVAIFASATLGELTRLPGDVFQRPQGGGETPLNSGTPGANTPLVTSPSDTGIAVAHVYDWNTEAYPRLGIKSGHNCLYLYGELQHPKAFMLSMKDPRDCGKPRSITSPGAVKLHVRRHVAASFTGSNDYPPVARWETDGKRRTWIGIRCGNAWCSVGPSKSFWSYFLFWGPPWDTEPRPAVIPSGIEATSARHAIRGWYDQQRLAYPTAGGLLPKGLSARIVPVDTLGDINDILDFKDHWVDVASVWFDGSDTVYQSKLNLRPGENKLALQLVGGANGNWMARITSANGVIDTFPVIRRGHENHVPAVGIPATARWRWMKNDETIWTRCAAGCCEVQSQPQSLSSSATGNGSP